MSEHSEAEAFMQWRSTRLGRWPELALLYHIPNEGQRSKWGHIREVQEGLLAGIPDYCLPIPRVLEGRMYGAWYHELKRPGEKPTKAQFKVHELLRTWYNYVTWSDNWQGMAAHCEIYLGVPVGERTQFFT